MTLQVWLEGCPPHILTSFNLLAQPHCLNQHIIAVLVLGGIFRFYEHLHSNSFKNLELKVICVVPSFISRKE